MAIKHSPRIVTDGLVAHYDAANTKSYPGSGTTWKDISGKGNDGTLLSGAAFDSSNNGVINLDGTNDRVDINYSPTLAFSNGIISCEIWVYLDALGNGFPLICKRGNGATNNDRPYVFGIHGDGYCRWILTDNGSGITVCDTAVLFEAGRWYHILATHDNSNSKIYLNGVEVKSVSSSINALETTNNNIKTRIGFRHTNTGSIYGNGRVAMARIYSKALTAAEVLQNYQALKERYL
jgi:hypothetical protein